jgi:hypothetical protein
MLLTLFCWTFPDPAPHMYFAFIWAQGKSELRCHVQMPRAMPSYLYHVYLINCLSISVAK